METPNAKPSTTCTIILSPAIESTLTPTENIEWLELDSMLTYYYYPNENDPAFQVGTDLEYDNNPNAIYSPGAEWGDPYVNVKIWDGANSWDYDEYKHKYGFIFSDYGVAMQGTGITEQGKYISVAEWYTTFTYGKPLDEISRDEWFFTYEIGGSYEEPEAWKTVAAQDDRFYNGARIIIEKYSDYGEFIVTDTGSGLGPNHLDIFIGQSRTIDAMAYGVQYSRVAIIN